MARAGHLRDHAPCEERPILCDQLHLICTTDDEVSGARLWTLAMAAGASGHSDGDVQGAIEVVMMTQWMSTTGDER